MSTCKDINFFLKNNFTFAITSIEAATEKSAERPKKTSSNYDDTERDRKAERMPKELKPLITLNITPNLGLKLLSNGELFLSSCFQRYLK